MHTPFWLSVWQLFILKISSDAGLMLDNVINLSHTSNWNKSSLRRILKSVNSLSDCTRNSMVSHGSLWALPFTKQEPILSFFFRRTNQYCLSKRILEPYLAEKEKRFLFVRITHPLALLDSLLPLLLLQNLLCFLSSLLLPLVEPSHEIPANRRCVK